MTNSVDGLVSGLSTSDLINQLMQVESAGQSRLKSKVTSQQKTISAYQSVNTKVAALKTATTAALEPTTWTGVKASSSSTAVTATASAGASTGKLILDVKELAQVGVKTATVSGTDSIQDGTGLSITVGDKTTAIDVTTDTAQGVVDAINKAGLGVNAALITTSDQGTVLQLTGAKTGAANEFSVSGLSATLATVTAASDAKIAVGSADRGGYTVTSSTNTFTGLMSGVTLTANQVASGVTVAVSPDTDGVADRVQAMVEAANSLLGTVDTQTAITSSTDSGTTRTSGSPLTGDFLTRQLSQDVLSAVSVGKADYGSFKQLGIQTDRNGRLTFDRAAFTAAYTADPTKTRTAIVDGLGKTLGAVATKANTNLTATIQSGTNVVRDLNKQIDDWDVRLQLRRDALQLQFTNLEVALGKMKDQSTWLAGQLSSLSSG